MAKCTRPLFQGRTGCGGRPSGWHDIVTCQHLVVTAATCSYELNQLTVINPYVSDHSFNAPFTRPPAQTVKFTTRSWVNFDINRFESNLAASDLGTTYSTDVHQLLEMYDTTLMMLLDKHAPRKRTVVHRRRPQSPWYDADCQQAKKEVRRLESIDRRRSSRRQLFTDCGAPRLFATTYYSSENSICSGVAEYRRRTATLGVSGRRCPAC